MFVLGDGFRESVEKALHRFGIGIRHDECKGIVRTRLDGGKNIGEGETPVAKSGRPPAPLPPDMADTTLLADPRFILKEQTYALTIMRTLNFLQQRRGSF